MKYVIHFLMDCYYGIHRLWTLIRPVPVKWKRLHSHSKHPFRAYETDGGFDLCAVETVTLPANSHVNVGTGIAVQVQPGWSFNLRGRSGLSRKGILCAMGLVDSFYNGELRAVLSNFSGEPYTIKPGDRVCQLQITPVFEFRWEEVVEFDNPPGTRGEKGWGSSGV